MGYIVVGVNSFPPTFFSKIEDFKTVNTQSHSIPNICHHRKKKIMRGGPGTGLEITPYRVFPKIDDVIAA